MADRRPTPLAMVGAKGKLFIRPDDCDRRTDQLETVRLARTVSSPSMSRETSSAVL